MKRIIAPTDFSPIAENACVYAAKLAAEIKAELTLLHITELPVAVAEYAVSDELFNDSEVGKQMEHLRNKLLDTTNHQINILSSTVLGFPDSQIAELCVRTKPFAVVMSSHPSDTFRRFLPASITESVARHLHFPVIVVPHNGVFKTYRKLAFACDMKNIYEIPVAELEAIMKAFNANLVLFYVGKTEDEIYEKAINDLLLNHRMEHLNIRLFNVEDKDVWSGISRLAKEQEIDMLIVLSKKHGLFHRSATKDFIRHADIPLMIIHEKDTNAKS